MLRKFFSRPAACQPHNNDDNDPRLVKKVKKTRALLIGINYFGTKAELKGCINDVNNVYRWLTKECGYDPAEIRVLTDESHVPDQFRPTRRNILSSMEWLHEIIPKEGDEEVNLFVHYSGHGSWSRDFDGDETDGRDESICPEDYSRHGVIKDDVLRQVLVDPVADKSNVKMTCLFDCCHSGTALDLRYEYEVSVASSNPHHRSFRVHQNKKLKSTKAHVVLWSGSLDKQYSADAFIAGKSQGAMTWGFLRTIRYHQARGRNISYKRMLAGLQLLLKKQGYEQIPHLCGGNYIDLKESFNV